MRKKLDPVTGLGRTTAVIVLTLYNQYILLRSFTAGLRDVDPAVCEAAKGIGMTDMQILTKIRVPPGYICRNPSRGGLYDRNRDDCRVDQRRRARNASF